MKIIKRGEIPEHRILALKHECTQCKTIFRLEAGDDYQINDNDFKVVVISICPICGSSVTTPLVRKPVVAARPAAPASHAHDS
jgi:rRNA maturation endonuclease Nob1